MEPCLDVGPDVVDVDLLGIAVAARAPARGAGRGAALAASTAAAHLPGRRTREPATGTEWSLARRWPASGPFFVAFYSLISLVPIPPVI